ncbi:MAG TPA: DUF1501 domain-containing protein [Nitrospira sp.]
MTRRNLLKFIAALPFVLLTRFPRDLQAASPEMTRGRWDRTLVLVELNGGNDGLNTLIPYTDDRYYQLRPRLAIPRERVLQLSPKAGLHQALEPLMSLWDGRELALVQGVGYASPNRSHFRSIEVWETASESEQVLDEGWLARLFEANPVPSNFTAEGVLLGRRDAGPLSGKTVRTIAMEEPQQFLRQAGAVRAIEQSTPNKALAHILQVQRELSRAAGDLALRLEQAPSLQETFPSTGIGRQLETAAQLLVAKIPVAAIKVSHGSFDTHANQLGQHERLLRELAEGLVAFRQVLRAHGMWDRTLIMSYSEFGRRVGENGSGGTDHGTAAPHFLLGGTVKGGLYGVAPQLADLQEGDLKYQIDYRSLYTTIINDWWDLPVTILDKKNYPALDCLG